MKTACRSRRVFITLMVALCIVTVASLRGPLSRNQAVPCGSGARTARDKYGCALPSHSHHGTCCGHGLRPALHLGRQGFCRPDPQPRDRLRDKDNRVWIIKLRKGVKFHNGREMTAEDVKTNFDWRITTPKGWKPVKHTDLWGHEAGGRGGPIHSARHL